MLPRRGTGADRLHGTQNVVRKRVQKRQRLDRMNMTPTLGEITDSTERNIFSELMKLKYIIYGVSSVSGVGVSFTAGSGGKDVAVRFLAFSFRRFYKLLNPPRNQPPWSQPLVF